MRFLLFFFLLVVVITAKKAKKQPKTTTTPSPTTPNMPEFLAHASDTAKKDYVDIATNDNIVKATKEKALLAWAQRNGEPLLSAYRNHSANVHFEKIQRDSRMQEIILLLSDSAQKADASIRSITNDDSLTPKQESDQIAKQFRKIKPGVRKELMTAMESANAVEE
ncbi:hypothetical protein PRIPAC_79610 [Pristionchus pacificus]|uniref:DUF148 domain-containing protein n=1 Tax=Pristionchus pacificus TaxID=54126 RepID=A0A2A6BED5_PRIPA|nr:hypothetical protein PRIPAC_79610 [Pristionchus pacificus]|eukprot:PDM64171.1 hypothetical protein PRIPAC_54415 [Pristionchus pacificus]